MFKNLIMIFFVVTIANSKELAIDGLVNIEHKNNISLFVIENLTHIDEITRVNLTNRESGISKEYFFYFDKKTKNLRVYLDNLEYIKDKKFSITIFTEDGESLNSSNYIKFHYLPKEIYIAPQDDALGTANKEKKIVSLETLKDLFKLNSYSFYDVSNNQRIECLENIRKNTIYRFMDKKTNENILYIAY